VVLALDADRAGADAMIRAQRVAGSRDMDLLVAAMPEGEDPADMLAAGEIERFKQLVDEAIDLPSFRVRTALGRADTGSLRGRERALAEVAPVLKAMGNAVGRDELVREVADHLDTDPSLVTERVKSAPEDGGAGSSGRVEGNGGGQAQPAPVQLTPREGRERALLAMCIADPKQGRDYMRKLRPEHFSAAGARAMEWLRDHLDDPMSGLPRDDGELASLITELVMSSERSPEPGVMELNFMLLEQERLEDGISAAQEAGEDDVRAKLIGERAALRDKIAHAESLGV
jgi:DNA primase